MIASTNQEPSQSDETVVLAPSDRRNAFLQLIGSANQDLSLSVFRCDDFAILDALADAVSRKVKVRALVTQTARNWDRRLRELETLLESMGALVSRYSGPLTKYHAKYVVADQSAAIVTSLNFTRKCFDQTADFLVLTRDRTVIEELLQLFAHDCGQTADSPHPRDSRLIVGPEKANRLLELLDGAKRTIRIVDHRLNDPQVLAILRRQQEAGVAVEVLGNGAIAGLTSHGRLFLIDDATAIIGSFALTPASLKDRREVALLLRDPANVDSLRAWFDRCAKLRPAESLKLAEFVSEDFSDDDE